jgi:hypothetical protein
MHQMCRQRRYRFSVLVGTIFENTNVPMLQWFKVVYFMLTSKGISALQIHRYSPMRTDQRLEL